MRSKVAFIRILIVKAVHPLTHDLTYLQIMTWDRALSGWWKAMLGERQTHPLYKWDTISLCPQSPCLFPQWCWCLGGRGIVSIEKEHTLAMRWCHLKNLREEMNERWVILHLCGKIQNGKCHVTRKWIGINIFLGKTYIMVSSWSTIITFGRVIGN